MYIDISIGAVLTINRNREVHPTMDQNILGHKVYNKSR